MVMTTKVGSRGPKARKSTETDILVAKSGNLYHVSSRGPKARKSTKTKAMRTIMTVANPAR